VVWEEVEDRVATMAELSVAFLTYMMVATVIAVVGILTDSLVLIVGAMVVGPEFGPLAALCVGLVQRKPSLARQGLTSLALGFAAAIAAAIVPPGRSAPPAWRPRISPPACTPIRCSSRGPTASP
jgi:uncharacterized hydrophobic protein (TIGR00271 family)